ncbi:MAG TPA: SGNH/GDSL hydrolase family protein [Smithella sp.]|nr:SGNH/GDSL hydrolase family protein [Smithella sp.]
MARKIIVSLVVCICIFGAAFIGIYKLIEKKAQTLPVNDPIAFVQQGHDAKKKVLVCIGDSLTHGTVSVSYVDMLSSRLSNRGIVVINAGINSQLAYNVTKRLDAIVACRPDYITILIGSNDAVASLSPYSSRRYIRQMKLPQPPTLKWYRENLLEICRELSCRTHAKIALISLPPIGERFDHPAFAASEAYSRVIRDVALSERLTYLPLHENMTAFLRARNPHPLYAFRDDKLLMYIAIARHFLLRQSYDDISRTNGFVLLTDHLHLNSTGAGMVADLIENFVTKAD